MDKPFFKKTAIIGVGLMGGSLARAMKKQGLTGTVSGAGRSQKNLETALELGIIDEIATAKDAVKDADIVILCPPVLSIIPTLEAIAPHIKEGAVVTDVGSVKKEIVEKAEEIAGERFVFVGSHPIAGSEKSGASAAFDTLYDDHRCVVTPTPQTPADALDKVETLWQAVGMQTVRMAPELHDRILAAVSHLPHLVVYALVNTVSDEDGAEDLITFAAGGFRDFTRIASSPPEMWADIFLANPGPVSDLAEKIRNQLERIETAIAQGDRDQLLALFEKSQTFRARLK